MIRVGILSFSDGRARVHESLDGYITQQRDTIARAIESTGEARAVYPDFACATNEQAAEAARWLTGENVDACILNVPVFAFPNFPGLAERLLRGTPMIAIAPVNGLMPGLGGLQAAVGGIRQSGGQCEKIWGDITDGAVLWRMMAFLRGARAATRLKGQVFGLYGGRSIGMISGAASQDVWLNQFGVDIDHVDQSEILRRAKLVPEIQTQRAMRWLKENLGGIEYDGDKLTEESLAQQVNCHIALKQLARERGHSFVGVKCHYDLSEYYTTQCLSAALCNDPYDWDGEKEPLVFSCEADADGALTMQVLKLISGKPVVFMDFRHYMEQEGIFAFCNCGACSTWYAAQSDNPRDNLERVKLCPIISKYGGKGAHVQFIAAQGRMTFARLTHRMDKYVMQAFEGDFRDMPAQKLSETCPSWPHGYAEIDGDPGALIERFESNHIHAVAGNYLAELRVFCALKGIGFEAL